MLAKTAACCFKPYGVRHFSNLTTLDPKGKIFTLTMNGKGENQHLLTADRLNSFLSNLNEVKSNASKGSVLITTAEGNNFCTGFPPDGYNEVVDLFKELVKELISLPMPTIAAINGYAMSAGLILAMSHDHLTMEPDNHLLSMVELDSQIPLPDYFTAMIRSKVVPGAFSRLALNTSPYDSKHAEQMGLAVHPPNRTEEKPLHTAIRFAKELSRKNWNGNHYAEIRKTLYPDLCNVLGLSCAPSSRL